MSLKKKMLVFPMISNENVSMLFRFLVHLFEKFVVHLFENKNAGLPHDLK
jgi:hypothetical protein